MKPDQRVFVGVVAPIDPRVETPEEVRDRVLEAAEYIPRRAARHHRRLRLLAVLRRHLDHARHGVREDPRARRGHGAGRRSSGAADESLRPKTKTNCSARSRCRTRRASCWRASGPSRSSSPRRRPSRRARRARRANALILRSPRRPRRRCSARRPGRRHLHASRRDRGTDIRSRHRRHAIPRRSACAQPPARPLLATTARAQRASPRAAHEATRRVVRNHGRTVRGACSRASLSAKVPGGPRGPRHHRRDPGAGGPRGREPEQGRVPGDALARATHAADGGVGLGDHAQALGLSESETREAVEAIERPQRGHAGAAHRRCPRCIRIVAGR